MAEDEWGSIARWYHIGAKLITGEEIISWGGWTGTRAQADRRLDEMVEATGGPLTGHQPVTHYTFELEDGRVAIERSKVLYLFTRLS